MTNCAEYRIISVQKALPVNGQPPKSTLDKITRLELVAAGGLSYAFDITIQIATRNTSERNSYGPISVPPFQGLRIDRLPFGNAYVDYNTYVSNVQAIFLLTGGCVALIIRMSETFLDSSVGRASDC